VVELLDTRFRERLEGHINQATEDVILLSSKVRLVPEGQSTAGSARHRIDPPFSQNAANLVLPRERPSDGARLRVH